MTYIKGIIDWSEKESVAMNIADRESKKRNETVYVGLKTNITNPSYYIFLKEHICTEDKSLRSNIDIIHESKISRNQKD